MDHARPLAVWWRSSWFAEAVIAIAIVVAGIVAGAAYRNAFMAANGPQDYAQPEFGAAVALACGHGFVDPGYSVTPMLDEFLNGRRDDYQCSDLAGKVRPARPNLTQGLYRYFMTAGAIVWRIRGAVSWSGLTPVFAIAYGLTLVAAYGLFRLGMGRVMSVAATLALLVSAKHLSYLPYLRDYAKAPFILALMLIMARLALGPVTRGRVLGYGIAFGAVLGIGFGFRNDLLINVPPFVALVALCLPGRLRDHLALKGSALIAAAATFLLVSWPIVSAYRAGSNTGHVALLGLMRSFDAPLGVHGSIYDWGYPYLDGFMTDIVQSYGARLQHASFEYLSADYDRAAVAYLVRIAMNWPADMLVRAYSSMLNVLQMPFSIGTYTDAIPYGISGTAVSRSYDWHIWLLQHLSGSGIAVSAAALAVVGGRSIRAGLILLAFLVYYAGYPAIQFHIRHFFHLEFIAWWAVAFLAERLFAAGRTLLRARPRSAAAAWHLVVPSGSLVRAGVFSAATVVLLFGSLTTLRAYQDPHVRTLIDGYLAAPREPLGLTVQPNGGALLVTSPHLWDAPPVFPVSSQYIVAEFSAAACRLASVPVMWRYHATETEDFSWRSTVHLAAGGDVERFFVPAYRNRQSSYFEGVELPRGHAGCLTSLSRIADLSQTPVLLDLALTPHWERATLHQTLAGVESSRLVDGPEFYTAPANTPVPRRALDASLESVGAPSLADPIARGTVAAPWTVRGRPASAGAELLRFGARRVPASAMLVAQGDLRRGGLSLAITQDGKIAAAVSVKTSGPFVAAVMAPRDGEYGVVVASDIVPAWPASQVGRRIGPFLEWIPGATLYDDFTITRLGWTPSAR